MTEVEFKQYKKDFVKQHKLGNKTVAQLIEIAGDHPVRGSKFDILQQLDAKDNFSKT